MSQATHKTFEDAATDFARFAESQGFPPSLLWITSDDIVFWIGRYFVFRGDADKRELQARAIFDGGIARSLGIELEGRCKTADLTICRVYVPADDIDAQYRMIPQQGVKMKVAVDPKPALLVKSRLLFGPLKWWRKRARPIAAWE